MDDQKPWLCKKQGTEKMLVADKANKSSNMDEDDVAEVQEFLALKGELEKNLTIMSAALSDCDSMETFAKKPVKIAQEAIAGWEKAKRETLSLKRDLDKVVQQKAAPDERSNQLEVALKDCTHQLHFVREEQEKRIQTSVVRPLEEFDETRIDLEQRLAEAGKRIVEIESANAQLKKALSETDKTIQELSGYRAQLEADFSALTLRVDSTEKENTSLKYEVRVLEKELSIRNEEAEFNRQAADVAQKKYKDSIQKIANLESECKRLRSLVQKRLLGPAALTKMKNEAEMIGRGRVGSRRKRSPSLCGSSGEFSVVADTPSKRISFLTEQLNALEDENRTLRNALTKKSSEMQVSRNMYVRAASRLSRGDESVKNFLQERSLATLSDTGSEDKASCAESWASAVISEPENYKNEKKSSQGNMNGSEMYLMDDFVEMEKFAVDSVDPRSSGHLSEEGKAIVGRSGGDDEQPLKTQLPNDKEITAASKKLAECQETILNLGKQFKELASPNDMALFDKVMSTTPVVSSARTSQRSIGKRLSLLDNMLAEDDKDYISAARTSAESLRKLTFDPNDIDGDAGPDAVCSMAIVPVKKTGGKSFFKKMFRWHKKGKNKKTPTCSS